jgi:tight adherence protein B
VNSAGFVAGLIFTVVAAIIIGAYWLLILQPEEREKSALRKRLKTENRGKPQAGGGLLKEAQRLSELHALDAVLRRVEGMTGPLQKLIDQSGVRTNVGTVMLTCGVLGIAAASFVTLMSRWWIGLPAGVILTFVPIFYLRFKRDRRVAKFEEQFPEAIDLIARALRAGHAFTTGLSMVADEITDPVGTEFRLLYERQNFGMPLPAAMREFAERIPVLDAKFFATAVLTQRESGGNLAEVLDNLSSVIRERFRVKRQVRVISAHGRMTGWVLALLPPSLAVAFMVISPGHIDMLLNDVLGIQMIVAALTLQVVGTLFIRKIVRIEY